VSRSREQDAWVEAWANRYPAAQEPKRRGRIRGRYSRGAWLLASAIAFAVLFVPAFAIAQGGGQQTFTSSARYTVLSRNTGNGSGGATAQTCNTTPGNQACENNVNSGTGLAATYRSRGLVAAQFQTSGSGQATPFTISNNATGMVENLNANMVGGILPTQLFANYQQVSQQSGSVTKGQGQTQSSQVTCPSGTSSETPCSPPCAETASSSSASDCVPRRTTKWSSDFSSVASRRFIDGLPMKAATKTLSGRS